MKLVRSVSGIPIRLSPERLSHIEHRHPEMRGQEERILETVASPDLVQEGDEGTLIALKHYRGTPLSEKFCSVVYKELRETDGFIVTAYFTSRPSAARRTRWKP